MVIIRLMGGLGNQLFQYALGRQLSWKLKIPLKLDITKLEKLAPPRKLLLDVYHAKVEIASSSDIWKVSIPHRSDFPARISNFIERFSPYYRRSVITEPHFHFSPEILKARRDVYLIGYWQSEKYFSDIKDIIIRDIKLSKPLHHENQIYLDTIVNTNAVSMHIRRGDYQTNLQYRNTYHECLPEYYSRAVQRVADHVEGVHVYAFSDEPAWVKNNIQLPVPMTVIEHQAPSSDAEDLYLISSCRHHIIANSTFSWWGAWLCRDPGKIVIAPEKWFKNPDIDTRDLIPSEWIRM